VGGGGEVGCYSSLAIWWGGNGWGATQLSSNTVRKEGWVQHFSTDSNTVGEERGGGVTSNRVGGGRGATVLYK